MPKVLSSSFSLSSLAKRQTKVCILNYFYSELCLRWAKKLISTWLDREG
jgi:hypothetical protein